MTPENNLSKQSWLNIFLENLTVSEINKEYLKYSY